MTRKSSKPKPTKRSKSGKSSLDGLSLAQKVAVMLSRVVAYGMMAGVLLVIVWVIAFAVWLFAGEMGSADDWKHF